MAKIEKTHVEYVELKFSEHGMELKLPVNIWTFIKLDKAVSHPKRGFVDRLCVSTNIDYRPVGSAIFHKHETWETLVFPAKGDRPDLSAEAFFDIDGGKGQSNLRGALKGHFKVVDNVLHKHD
ncbi:MAG: hypothetical protein KKD17_01860 [Nanoarchaeota archaeon]|nr:hypothetical protein [Nanoarchaeota archaeon]